MSLDSNHPESDERKGDETQPHLAANSPAAPARERKHLHVERALLAQRADLSVGGEGRGRGRKEEGGRGKTHPPTRSAQRVAPPRQLECGGDAEPLERHEVVEEDQRVRIRVRFCVRLCVRVGITFNFRGQRGRRESPQREDVNEEEGRRGEGEVLRVHTKWGHTDLAAIARHRAGFSETERTTTLGFSFSSLASVERACTIAPALGLTQVLDSRTVQDKVGGGHELVRDEKEDATREVEGGEHACEGARGRGRGRGLERWRWDGTEAESDLGG
ncbi:hypothetical protein DFH09DRAFT_1074528 [Mycena vulgaris]|nr:hypothetical protein DFH09DRAFT_1074528 [Mycena vulgaris]